MSISILKQNKTNKKKLLVQKYNIKFQMVPEKSKSWSQVWDLSSLRVQIMALPLSCVTWFSICTCEMSVKTILFIHSSVNIFTKYLINNCTH